MKYVALICLFLILICTSSAQAKGDFTKVLLVHSYDLSLDWTKEQHDGLIQELSEQFTPKQYEIKHYFMNSKKEKSEQKIKFHIQNIIHLIDQFNPDGIAVTDDLAFKSLYKVAKQKKIPLTFSGVNKNVEFYGVTQNEEGVCGIQEKYKVMPVIKLLKLLNPKIKKLAIVSETSLSGQLMFNDFKEQMLKENALKKAGIAELIEFVDTDYEKLKKFLLKLNPNDTAVFFVANYTYHDGKGNYVDFRTINRWFIENTKLIDVGIGMFTVRNGKLLSFSITGERLGRISAKMLVENLKNNKALQAKNIMKTMPLTLSINHKRAEQLGLQIPFEILTYAKSIDSLNKLNDSN